MVTTSGKTRDTPDVKSALKKDKSKWTTSEVVHAIGVEGMVTLHESVPPPKGRAKAFMAKAKASLEEKVRPKEHAKDGRKEGMAGVWLKEMAGKEARVKGRASKENAGLAARQGIVQMNAGQ